MTIRKSIKFFSFCQDGYSSEETTIRSITGSSPISFSIGSEGLTTMNRIKVSFLFSQLSSVTSGRGLPYYNTTLIVTNSICTKITTKKKGCNHLFLIVDLV